MTRYDREQKTGHVTRVTHPGGVDYVDLNYSDPNNPYYVISRRDERNHYTFYDRDGNNRVWQIRYPDGAFEQFQYNNLGQVVRHLRRNGKYDHFEYDWVGRLMRVWNPTPNPNRSYGEPHSRFEYYENGPWAGRVRVVYDPRNNWTLYEYDLDSARQPCAGRGLVTKITHVDSTYLSFGYDQAGNLIWQENELREHTAIRYDDYNRPIAVIPPAPASPVTLTYEPTFGPPNPYLHTAPAVHFQTDGAGVTVENKYDRNFRLTSITQVDGTASPPTTRFEYWPVGTLRLVRDPRNQNWTTSYLYDGRRQLESVTDALNRTTRLYRDAAGNVEWIDRPDGKRESRTYDPMNRMRTQVEPLNAGANKTTVFSYWPSGRVHTIQDNNQQITTFEYDHSDRRQFMFYPDNTYQQWGYDEANNLVGHRTVGGKIQRFQPDNRNRITDTWWDPGDPSQWAHFVYDDANRLTQASNQYGTITRQYDDAGRLFTEEQNVSGLGAKTVSYGSDGAGKVTAMGIVGTDYQFAYEYDAIGRFEQILNVQSMPGGVTKSLWYQYLYDAASNETQRFCPMNGVAQVYRRDPLGRIDLLKVEKVAEPQYAVAPAGSATGGPLPPLPPLPSLPGLLAGLTNLLPKTGATVPPLGTVIESEEYIHDPNMDWVTNVNRQYGLNDTFGYDFSGQLTSASYAQWNGPGTRNVIYSQDALGNRGQVNDNGNVQGYSSHPSYRNQYVSAPAGAVNNGAEHEIAGYQGLSYTYLGDGKLASVSGNGSSYGLAYDALGRCVKRTLNGATTYYTYDGAQPIYEWKADGSRAGWNVYGKGIDEILLRADYQVLSGGQGYFFQQNRLGSVTHLTGFSGETIESYRYDAFGAPTTTYTGGSFNNRFKFTGREFQPNFGIYEYRARAYHPGLGRFLSEDPIGFAAGDTNLFRYCGGDPVNATDPFGLTPPGKQGGKNYNKEDKGGGGDNKLLGDGIPAGSWGTLGGGDNTPVYFGANGNDLWVGNTSVSGSGVAIGPWGEHAAGSLDFGPRDHGSSGSGPGDGSAPRDGRGSGTNSTGPGANSPSATANTHNVDRSGPRSTGGIRIKGWPEWLTFPEMGPVDPETWEWTKSGFYPTLIYGGAVFAPVIVPEIVAAGAAVPVIARQFTARAAFWRAVFESIAGSRGPKPPIPGPPRRPPYYEGPY